SGATGLYGANTIAGAVNFQTLSPTLQNHLTVEGGYGSFNKGVAGAIAPGTIGKLRYPLPGAAQSTDGELGPPHIQQPELLTSPAGKCPGGVNSIPSITNADKAGCTYSVSGTYLLRNYVGKLQYSFDPKTQVQFTGYIATMWANSSGNGDTDYDPANNQT